jgi:hypothetical protein
MRVACFDDHGVVGNERAQGVGDGTMQRVRERGRRWRQLVVARFRRCINTHGGDHLIWTYEMNNKVT